MSLQPPPRHVKPFSQIWKDWLFFLYKDAAPYIQILRLDAIGSPALGGSAPAEVFLNKTVGWKFAVGDSINMNVHVPHNWKRGTDMIFTCHFYSTNTTASRYVRGTFDWMSIGMGERITAPGSSGSFDSGDILLSTTSDVLGEFSFQVIPGSSISEDDHIFMQLTRTASIGTAPAVGDNPVLMHFELNYTAQNLGT